MTNEQVIAARKRLKDLAFGNNIPNFAERIQRNGDLRSQAVGAAKAAASGLIRNPEEVGVEKMYGLHQAEVDAIVDEIADDLNSGQLSLNPAASRLLS